MSDGPILTDAAFWDAMEIMAAQIVLSARLRRVPTMEAMLALSSVVDECTNFVAAREHGAPIYPGPMLAPVAVEARPKLTAIQGGKS